MLLSDKFKFGKFKDTSLQDTLKTEEGRNWLWWFIAQPCINSKYLDMDTTTKKAIKRQLEKIDGPVDGHSNAAVSSGVAIISHLNRIEEKLDKLLSFEGLQEKEEEKGEEWAE